MKGASMKRLFSTLLGGIALLGATAGTASPNGLAGDARPVAFGFRSTDTDRAEPHPRVNWALVAQRRKNSFAKVAPNPRVSWGLHEPLAARPPEGGMKPTTVARNRSRGRYLASTSDPVWSSGSVTCAQSDVLGRILEVYASGTFGLRPYQLIYVTFWVQTWSPSTGFQNVRGAVDVPYMTGGFSEVQGFNVASGVWARGYIYIRGYMGAFVPLGVTLGVATSGTWCYFR